MICLKNYVDDLDDSAEEVIGPMQDEYDGIAAIVSAIEDEVADTQI